MCGQCLSSVVSWQFHQRSVALSLSQILNRQSIAIQRLENLSDYRSSFALDIPLGLGKERSDLEQQILKPRIRFVFVPEMPPLM